MKNISIGDYRDEKEPSVSVSGDGNREAAERVLKELDKYPIVSHAIRVSTIIRSDGTDDVSFFLNMKFKTSSEAQEAYKAAGGK